MVKQTDKTNALKTTTLQDRIKASQELFLIQYEKKACNVTASCRALGINRDTYYEWRKHYPEFDTKCKELEQGLIDFAESQLLKNIGAGKETSLIFFLCNRAKDKWKNVQKVEHAGIDDKPIKYIIEYRDNNAGNRNGTGK